MMNKPTNPPMGNLFLGATIGVIFCLFLLAGILQAAGVEVTATLLGQVAVSIGVVSLLFVYRSPVSKWLMNRTASRSPATRNEESRMVEVGNSIRAMTFSEAIVALQQGAVVQERTWKERNEFQRQVQALEGRVNTLTQTGRQWKAEAQAQTQARQRAEQERDVARQQAREGEERAEQLETALTLTVQERDTALQQAESLTHQLSDLQAKHPTTPKPTTWKEALAFAHFIRGQGDTANWVAFRDAVRGAGYVIKGEDIPAMQAAIADFQSLPSAEADAPLSPTPQDTTPSLSDSRTEAEPLMLIVEKGRGEVLPTEGKGTRKAGRKPPRKARSLTRKAGGRG
jgi:hypothetical protein